MYDRAVPPTEAVALLDEVLEKIVMELKMPVLAIGGNHDSPGRLHFGSGLMQENGYHIAGKMTKEIEPVVLQDEYGEVHFHLVPFADPSVVKHLHDDETISNHNDAMRKITEGIQENMEKKRVMFLLDMHSLRRTGKVKKIRVIQNVQSPLAVRNMCRPICLSHSITRRSAIYIRPIMC